VALALAAYLVGSIPVGYLVGRWRRGIDVREYGTGNPGASNVYRNVGPAEGVGVALACVAQGLWPVLVTRSLGYPALAAGLAGLAAVAGYAWPVFLRFRGGRAVATSVGVLVGLWPGPVAALAAFFALGLLLDRYALAMFVGFAALPVYLWLTGEAPQFVALAIGVYLFLVVRRLSGVQADLRGAQRPAEIVLQRLLHDRRPGQRLVGKRGT
jgi:glycerol-3-phosphate acyltransferase PlsY